MCVNNVKWTVTMETDKTSSDSDEEISAPKKSKSSRRRGVAYKLTSNPSLTKPISSSSAIYSTCVSRCFSNIKSHSFKEDVKRVLMESVNDDVEDDNVGCRKQTKNNQTKKKQTTKIQTTKPVLQKADTLLISDEEDEDENSQNIQNTDIKNTSITADTVRSPSPPPPPEISIKSRRARGGKQKKNLLSAADALSKNLSDAQSQLKDTTDVQIPESDVYVIDDDDDMTVRIDILGSIQRYKLAADELFSSLFGRIAVQQRVPEKQLMLVHKDRTLRPTETPQSVKLTTADIIKCHITDESMNDSITYDKDEDLIELVLQTRGSKSKQLIKTPRDKPLMILMKDYASRINTDVSSIQFWFDGEILSQKETPEDLDMDDGDIIDVNVTGVTVIN